VSHFRAGTTDLMRPLSAAHWASGDVLGTAIFPMVPYANRFEGNRFHFGGAQWEVETNNPPERFNVHGTGWRVPWRHDCTRPPRLTVKSSCPAGAVQT